MLFAGGYLKHFVPNSFSDHLLKVPIALQTYPVFGNSSTWQQARSWTANDSLLQDQKRVGATLTWTFPFHTSMHVHTHKFEILVLAIKTGWKRSKTMRDT